MRNRLIMCGAFMAALAVASPAPAQEVVDRAQVGVPGAGSPTRGFAENLSVVLTAPSRYERSCCADFVSGAWDGPRVEASDSTAQQNRSRIEWSVTFKRGRKSARSLARAAGWADYPEIAGRKRRVPHIVGGRRVGSLPAWYAIDGQPTPGAKVQAAIAVSLGRRVHGITLLHLPDPFADRSAAGTLTVEGRPASEWNRAKAREALENVTVEGSLPPKRVKLRARGGRVKGTVRDSFGHPVWDAEVTLQRRSPAGWRDAKSGRTSKRGAFSLRAASGRYRVVASLAGSSARSRAVRTGG